MSAEKVLIQALIDEYGEDAETWGALRSPRRILAALAAAGIGDVAAAWDGAVRHRGLHGDGTIAILLAENPYRSDATA